MGFLNNRHRPDLDNHGKELFYDYLHDDDLESALKIWEESTPLSRLAEVAFCEETLELELKQDPKRLAVIRQCDEDIKRMMALDQRSGSYVQRLIDDSAKGDDQRETTGEDDDGDERA